MRIKLIFIMAAWALFLVALAPVAANAQEPDGVILGSESKIESPSGESSEEAYGEALGETPGEVVPGGEAGMEIFRAKLKAESLPEGLEILKEIWATDEQLSETRRKLGLALGALLSQTIAREDEKAQVNFMALPDSTWVARGYFKLWKDKGRKTIIFMKGNMLIQMVATTKELEDRVIELLNIDPFQTHKLRWHRVPREWSIIEERFLKEGELRVVAQESGGIVSRGLMQDIMVDRAIVKVRYYDCVTESSAGLVGESLADRWGAMDKRMVRGYGSIIVTVDSLSEKLNKVVFSYLD